MKKEVKACDLKVGDSFTFDTNLESTLYTVTETNNERHIISFYNDDFQWVSIPMHYGTDETVFLDVIQQFPKRTLLFDVRSNYHPQNELYKLSCKMVDTTIYTFTVELIRCSSNETSKQIHTPMNSVATNFKPVQCECGAHKLGYPEGPAHSTWCELYRKG